MIFVDLQTTDPHFNLAAEEYFLKNFSENVFIIWQSTLSVVVGKHQNMLAEVNYPYALEHSIPLVRRLSGGGTVVHDSGNINFTFIYNGTEGALVNFAYFMQPVVDCLVELGLRAVRSQNNDILVEGLKVSGNAEHIYKNRVLHHGTLLFNSDLNQIENLLRPSASLYQSKAVKSKRVAVTNIQQHLTRKYSTDSFREILANYVATWHKCHAYKLSAEDIAEIQNISNEKYALWKWNFGYSPNYKFTSSCEDCKLHLDVRRGIIEDAILSLASGKTDVISIRNLKGLAHDNFKAIKPIIDEKIRANCDLCYKTEYILY